jgi:hypothetical protein
LGTPWTNGRDPRPSRPDRGESGAALVEFALVMPLLMAFLLGIITIGATYNRFISMNNSAREAARYGAVLPVDGDLDDWLHTVTDVAVAATSGDVDGTSSGHWVCVAYVYPDGTVSEDLTRRLVMANGSRTLSTGNTCVTDGRPNSERRVQVVLQRPSRLETVFFADDFVLDVDSVARFERLAE